MFKPTALISGSTSSGVQTLCLSAASTCRVCFVQVFPRGTRGFTSHKCWEDYKARALQVLLHSITVVLVSPETRKFSRDTTRFLQRARE